MKIRSFRTSGTTGRPKEFDLSDELLAARVRRLPLCKGAEFSGLKSIYYTLPFTSTGGARNVLWAAQNGVTLHRDLTADADGVIGSPATLLRVAGRRFRYVLSTGAPLSPDVCRTIRERLVAPGGVMYASYGASEAGSIALATVADVEATPGCVGRVLPDVDAEIVASQLRVRTPTMVSSQVRPDGWFYPGDLAEWGSDGALILRGRSV